MRPLTRANDCKTRVQTTKTAQGKLEEAQTVHDLYESKVGLERRIEAKSEKQDAAGVIPVDSTKHTADGIAKYLSVFATIDPGWLSDRRAFDIALTGEAIAAWGVKVLLALIHGIFSRLRSSLCRKEEVQPDMVEQMPTLTQAAQPPPQIRTHTPHVMQDEERPPLPVERTYTPMKRTTTPEKPKRKDYAVGVMEWLKGVAQTPEGERYTPSGLHLPYAKFCERAGFPIAAVNIFSSIVRNEGGLTARKSKGQDYFRVTIRGVNTTHLKIVKA